MSPESLKKNPKIEGYYGKTSDVWQLGKLQDYS